MKKQALSQRWFDAGPKSTTLTQHQTIIGSAYLLEYMIVLTHSAAGWRIYKGVIRDSCTVPGRPVPGRPVTMDTGCAVYGRGGVLIKDESGKKH